MAVYPVESEGYSAYGRSTQYLKQSIEFYSKTYFEYPWNSAVVVAGVALGMEYPGIVFCSYEIKTEYSMERCYTRNRSQLVPNDCWQQ